MRYIKFSLNGINRYVAINDTKQIDKLFKQGYEPCKTAEGRFIYKEFGVKDYSKAVSQNKTADFYKALAAETELDNSDYSEDIFEN